MARRIKEEPATHRMRIAKAAGQLFEAKGTDAVTMSDIAREAGYSKATLYVYFQNKEEIVGYLVLDSMKKLKEYLSAALAKDNNFSVAPDYINIDFEHSCCEESERETFQVGEEINAILISFFTDGIKNGIFRKQTDVKAVIFAIWGMLSGFIQLAVRITACPALLSLC